MTSVRPADADSDAQACRAIYAPAVDGPVSFEEAVPDAAEMRRRIGAAHAWLVCERDGAVAGFAYADAHRGRPGYRWTTEVSVYVDAAHHRRGVGRTLYEELLALLRRRGFRTALGGITLPNDQSIALHQMLGFVPVGVYRHVGYKAGAWRDVGWWQLDLGALPGEPPPEPQDVGRG